MTRRWPLIGIAGLARAGKDTLARRLTDRWGFQRIGFADALRAEVRAKFPRTLLTIWAQSQEGGPIPTASADRGRLLDLLIESKPPAVRALLQEFGTEVRRADNEDYWVARWLDTAGQDWARRIVVPDLRFENEATTIKRWGYLVKVTRPDAEGAGTHASETGVTAWPDSAFDWVVANDGTIEALWAQVDAWVGRHYEGWQ